MQGSTRPNPTGRSRLSRLAIAATVLIAVLVAGCGGSSPGPTRETVGGASTSASRTAALAVRDDHCAEHLNRRRRS